MRSKLPILLVGVALVALVLVTSGVRPLTAARSRRSSPARVCSMLRRAVSHATNVDRLIDALLASAPSNRSLVLDVGLAHGKECFAIAESGHVCRGFEADPHHARLIIDKAARHPQAARLQIRHAAVGDADATVEFFADRHNRHGVGGTLSAPGSGYVRNTSMAGWSRESVPLVRLDGQVEPHESVYLLKSDTQGHEMGVLRGAAGLFASGRVRFVLVEMAIRLLQSGNAIANFERKAAAQLEEAVQIIELLHGYGFTCCDLPWHDRVGSIHALEGATRFGTPVDAWAWAETLARYPVGKNGFVFTDLLCEA